MRKIILPLLFSVLLAGCTPEDLFSMLAQSDVEQAAGESVSQSEEVLKGTQGIIESKMMEFDQSVLLGSEDDDGSYGYGYRNNINSEGDFIHEVIAILPPLEEEGAFYEGWLVDLETEEFISTGPMQISDDGQIRSISFNSTLNFDSYSQVVITKELVKDNTPEEHVLEGTFE